MKQTTICLIICGVLRMSSTFTAIAEDPTVDLIFEGDFSKPSPLWGSSQKGGELLLDRQDVLTPIELSDFVIEYDTQVRGAGISEILFRVDEDSGRSYMFRVDTRGDSPDYKPGFLMAGPGREAPWWLVGERFGHSPKPSESVHVKVEALGAHMTAYVNGEEVARYTDDTLSKGALGFRRELCDAAFDNLKIHVPKGAAYYVPRLRKRQRPESKVKHNPYLNPAWTACWIWSKATDEELDRCLRKTFTLSRMPYEAHVAITADNAYTLYVNGVRIGSDDDWYSLETYDIRPHLRVGRNVLAARVRNEAPGSAGLLLEGWANYLDGSGLHIISDTSWRASTVKPPGWEGLGFDDSDWPSAISYGKHPCAPWGDQSNLLLPFFGPKQPIELLRWSAPSQLAPGRSFEVTVAYRPPAPLTHDYPLVIRARAQKGTIDLGSFWPKPATSRWQTAKERTIKAAIRMTPRTWYLVGEEEIEVTVELRGTRLLPGGADPARKASLLPPSQSPKPIWSLKNGRLYCEGAEYDPIDEDGVYLFRVEPEQPPMPKPRTAIQTIVNESGLESALRCRLVDAIDCTREDHDFDDDYGLGGRSRILTINGKRYRVTSARPKLSYFFYTASVRRPGEPHLIVAEIPNDIERYVTIRVYPQGSNPGSGIYTGREYPCDGRSVLHTFLFYPQRERFSLSVSRLPVELERRPESGAAVSRIWIFEVLDPLAARAVKVERPKRGPGRRLGMYLTAPGYIYSLYGFPNNTETSRRASIRSFIDYMKFCGMNLLEYNAIDGGDIAQRAFYDSEVYDSARRNVFRDLLPAAEREGIEVIPIVTSLACPSWRRKVDKQHRAYPGWSDLSYQWDKDGKQRTSFFGMWLPDPLRPEVQELLMRCLREICERCTAYQCVPAIGFRVNGKIGLCYAGSSHDRCGQDTGYSPWDVAELRRETGIEVPDMKPTAYGWLRERAWGEWLDWRCRRMRAFWLEARNLVRSYRTDWKLLVSCDLPSETPGYNIEWPRGERPLDLMRHHGYDPRLFVNDSGIIIQRGMMIASDRYFTRHRTYGENVWAHKAFNYAPGVTELYRTPEGAACELYHDYWEEGAPGGVGQFPRLAASTMYPLERYYFEPISFSLEKTNPHTMVVFSWERGSMGHEHDVRRFARAFRSLPYVEPRDFKGEWRVVSESPKLPPPRPASDKPQPMTAPYRSPMPWIKWFDDRLAVLNASDAERIVEIELSDRWSREDQLKELATGKTVATHNGRIRLVLKPYDLRVIAALRPAQ